MSFRGLKKFIPHDNTQQQQLGPQHDLTAIASGKLQEEQK